ncbi:hypothetical protein LSUE1_G005763 [Lachnellula suecica]|uniref:Uncharacterized protein n=1 Tax=Lachnellula suecica TaxID=602035 RepID=A0A8T9C4V3_9HELO|nr:hypothetical protein LSUE1_G005763 [Lachnellula suecica]
MPFPKRWIPILSFLTAGCVFWLVKPSAPIVSLDSLSLPLQTGTQYTSPLTEKGTIEGSQLAQVPFTSAEQQTQEPELGPVAKVPFRAGTLKAVGASYTKTIIVPKTIKEDVNWIEENFGSDTTIRKVIYVADDPTAELHPPKNKGHEVMIYLSYIIDHYNNLSDVNIFMHSTRFSWHGNDLLDNDAVQMISRLSSERVQREGFMNMRCHWDPGCPAWMHPGAVEEDFNKQEETMLARTWSELFPLDSIPEVLAQPCCAQFAISSDTIRSQPLARYVFYRDWLLRTNLSDYISGRIWEYVWQFIFTGKNVVCPKEHACYCDGFGVCLGGEDEYTNFYARRKERNELESELIIYHEKLTVYRESKERGEETDEIEAGKDLELEGRIEGLKAWEEQKKQLAKERGDVAINRAKEAGREWKDGDGF